MLARLVTLAESATTAWRAGILSRSLATRRARYTDLHGIQRYTRHGWHRAADNPLRRFRRLDPNAARGDRRDSCMPERPAWLARRVQACGGNAMMRAVTATMLSTLLLLCCGVAYAADFYQGKQV